MNNKTQTFREKGRAVFLAAIMVLSVVAMTASFGAAPAAATTQNVALDDATVTEGDELSGTVTVGNTDDSSVFVFVDANEDTYWNESEEPFVEVDVSGSDGQTDYTFDGLETDGIVGTQVGSFVDSSATDGQQADETTPVTINNDLNVELDAPEIVQNQSNYPAEVTVTNEGDANATGVDIELELDAPPPGSYTATNSSNGNTLAPGESETVSVLVDASDTEIGNVSNGINATVSGDDYPSETIEQNARVGQNGTAFIDGDIGDDQVNPIEDDQDIRLVVNNDDTGDEVVNETFGNFSTLDDDNGFVESAGFTSSSDRSGDLLGTYFIEFNQVDTTANYTFNASLEGFKAFDGPVTGTIGEQSDRNLRLERIVDADNLEVTDPPQDSVFDLEETFDATVLVETEDTEENGIGTLAPLEGEDVEASNFTASFDNPNDAGADLVITPTTNTTESDGTTQFAISLNLDQSVDQYDEDIDAGIRFDATSSDEFDVLNVTFQAEPPSGEGTISGTVDEINESIQLGTQDADTMSNIEAAEGVNVHAVQSDRLLENTHTRPIAGDTEEYARVVVWNETSNEVVDVLNVQTDYLFWSANGNNDNVSLSQNLTIAGTGFDADNPDFGAESYAVSVLEPDSELADGHTYAVQNTSDGNFTSGVDTVAFDAQNNLTYEGTQDRYEDSQAVHTDVTNENGDFELLNLYTEVPEVEGVDQGRDYVVIAGNGNPELSYANARGYDQVTVYPDSQANSGDEQYEADLSVQQREVTITADTVNVTQWGTHPPLDETGGAPDVSEIVGFPEQGQDRTDDTFQQVSRDGTVDVIRVDTTSSEFDTGVASNATVELADDFDGQFLDVVLDGDLNADSSLLLDNDQENTTIDISTDENGIAYVLLQTEDNTSTLNTQKIASIDNGDLFQDEDRSNVTFSGVLTFESGSISGDISNDDELLPNTFVWTAEFELANGDTAFTINPNFTASPIDSFDDLSNDSAVANEQVSNLVFDFVVNDTSTTPETTVEEFQVTGEELKEFDMADNVTAVSRSSDESFNLLRSQSEHENGDYSMDRVPATDEDGVDYRRLAAVQYGSADTGNGSTAEPVRTGFTVEGNVVIVGAQPLQSDFEVSNLTPQTATVNESEEFDVSADIENVGDLTDTQDIELEIVNDSTGTVVVSENQSVNLGSGANDTVTFEDVSVSDAGDYTHTVSSDDDSVSGSLTVQESDWYEPYTNDNDVATLDGALDAIDDYESGELSLDRVLTIIDSYETGTPVPQLE